MQRINVAHRDTTQHYTNNPTKRSPIQQSTRHYNAAHHNVTKSQSLYTVNLHNNDIIALLCFQEIQIHNARSLLTVPFFTNTYEDFISHSVYTLMFEVFLPGEFIFERG